MTKLTPTEQTVLIGVDAVYGGLWYGALRRQFRAAAKRLIQRGLLKQGKLEQLTLTKEGRASVEVSRPDDRGSK